MLCVLANSDGLSKRKGVNIYHVPRQAPSKVIYGETGSKVKLSDFDGDFVLAVFGQDIARPACAKSKASTLLPVKTKDDGIRVIMISPKRMARRFFRTTAAAEKFGGNDPKMYVDDKNDMASALGIFPRR